MGLHLARGGQDLLFHRRLTLCECQAFSITRNSIVWNRKVLTIKRRHVRTHGLFDAATEVFVAGALVALYQLLLLILRRRRQRRRRIGSMDM